MSKYFFRLDQTRYYNSTANTNFNTEHIFSQASINEREAENELSTPIAENNVKQSSIM